MSRISADDSCPITQIDHKVRVGRQTSRQGWFDDSEQEESLGARS